MLYLLAGLVIFFAVHAVRMLAPQFRSRQIEALGEGTWKGVYSIISFAGLALIIIGWSFYRPEAPAIYVTPDWMRNVTALLVLAGFIFIAAAYAPTGRIKAMLVHPFLAGIMLWALGHLLVNGDLASILLFGSFLAYGVWNRVAVARRDIPAPVSGGPMGDVVAIVVGAVLFALFVAWLHAVLFGSAPMG